MFNWSVSVPPQVAKLVLSVNPFHKSLLVMCKGYSEDDKNFTELVWADDKHLDFLDKESYPEFQLWFRTGI